MGVTEGGDEGRRRLTGTKARTQRRMEWWEVFVVGTRDSCQGFGIELVAHPRPKAKPAHARPCQRLSKPVARLPSAPTRPYQRASQTGLSMPDVPMPHIPEAHLSGSAVVGVQHRPKTRHGGIQTRPFCLSTLSSLSSFSILPPPSTPSTLSRRATSPTAQDGKRRQSKAMHAHGLLSHATCPPHGSWLHAGLT